LKMGSHFLPKLAWTRSFCFTLLTIGRMTGTCHHACLFSVEMGSHEHFARAAQEPHTIQFF
jgi:hypothetical protein